MPNINTKFTLSGEKEYKEAISEIGNGMRVLDSEMRKVQSAYAQNADSVEALNAKNDVLDRKISSQTEKIEYLKAALQQSAEKYGESDKKTMAWQTSLNNAEAELNKLNNQIDENNEKIKKSGEEMGNLGDTVGNLTSKFGIQLPDGIKGTMNKMGSLNTSSLALVGGLAAVAAAIVKVEKALISMTKESAAYADNILTMSQTTGQSTEQLQEFAYATELIDVSMDTLQGSLTKLTNNMQDTANGTGNAKASFEALGISVTNADGSMRSANDVFYETIDALGGVKNETERDAMAMDIFGRSAQDLNPLIVQGSDTLREYAQEAHDMGYVLDNEALAALGGVDDGFQRLQKTQEAVKNQIAAEFAPYLTEALEDIRELIQKVGKALVESGAVDAFGSILTSATELLAPLGDLVVAVLPALEVALKPIATTMALIADTANLLVGILTLNGDKIKTALGFGISEGQLSNMQKLQYKNAMSGSTYVAGKGYVGSGAGGYIEAGTGRYIPGNASGTDYFYGGRTLVGENGPELLTLPAGARIQTASETRQIGGDTYNITIDAHTVQEFEDIIRIVQDRRRVARMEGAR